MKIKFWGVRGSLPYSLGPMEWIHDIEHLMRRFFKLGYKSADDIKQYITSLSVPQVAGYGAATTCVQVSSTKGSLIIDGGSGLKNYSDDLIRRQNAVLKEHHIFLTHFHWDHLLGLPFFAPNFLPGHTVHYYAVQPDMAVWIKGKFRKPYFPVPFEDLRANVVFHVLEPRTPFHLHDMTLTPYQLDHPDPCWGLKIEFEGKAYAHCVDTEGTRVSPEDMGPDLPLYQGIDLMYFDAQYTLPELAEKINWGHSAAQIGLDIAFREGIRHVLFGHHDPGAGKGQIAALKDQTRDYYNWKLDRANTNRIHLPNVKWRFAYEGLEIDLNLI